MLSSFRPGQAEINRAESSNTACSAAQRRAVPPPFSARKMSSVTMVEYFVVDDGAVGRAVC